MSEPRREGTKDQIDFIDIDKSLVLGDCRCDIGAIVAHDEFDRSSEQAALLVDHFSPGHETLPMLLSVDGLAPRQWQ